MCAPNRLPWSAVSSNSSTARASSVQITVAPPAEATQTRSRNQVGARRLVIRMADLTVMHPVIRVVLHVRTTAKTVRSCVLQYGLHAAACGGSMSGESNRGRQPRATNVKPRTPCKLLHRQPKQMHIAAHFSGRGGTGGSS
eukprot:2764921-Prymnesium_polylepis.2